MRLHTVLIPTLPPLQISRTIPRRPPNGLQLVPIARRRSIDSGYTCGGFGRRAVVDVNVDGLVERVRGGWLSDGGGTFGHEELDDFAVLAELLGGFQLIEGLFVREVRG